MKKLFFFFFLLTTSVSAQGFFLNPFMSFPPAGCAGLVCDNFNRANSTDLGTNWTVINGNYNWRLQTNQADFNVASIGAEYYNTGTFANDQYAQAICKSTETGTARGAGACVRVTNPGSVTTFYLVMAGTSTLWLYKIVSGTYTQLGTGTAAAVNDVVRIEAQGTTIRVKVNGTERISVTDTSITSGVPGLHSLSDTASEQVDDFEAGDL